MKDMFFFLIVLFLNSNALAASNGWIASGGYVTTDDTNPWWLQNTKTVNYCIKIDKESISASEDLIESTIKKALNDWESEWEFYNSSVFFYSPTVPLGTQKFIQTDCNGSEDLTFYFGWNSLDKEKKEYISSIKNQQSIVGIAVRTNYDPIYLRGRGFIFLNSDIGKDQFFIENRVDKPWNIPYLLHTGLFHETAHLFGIQHDNSTPNILNENIFDMIMNKEVYEIFIKGKEIKKPGFFSGIGRYVYNGITATPTNISEATIIKDLFNLPEDINIENIVITTNDNGDFLINSISKDNKYTQLGSITDIKSVGFYSMSNSINIYLTDKQQVFDEHIPNGEVAIKNNFIDRLERASGLILMNDPLKRSVYIERSRHEFKISYFFEDNFFVQINFISE